VPGDDGRVDAAGDVTQLVEREGDLLPESGQLFPHALVGRQFPLEQPQLQRQGDQPLLRAVVQVPLEPAALGLRRLDHPRPRAVQLLQSGLQLGLQPAVLERDPRRRADAVQQLGFVAQRRVVQQGRHRLPGPLDHGRHEGGAGAGQLDRRPVAVGPRPPRRQPVGDDERRVAQRTRDQLLQVVRRAVAQPHDEVTDAGPGQPRVEEAREERERCEADEAERHKPKDLETGQRERARDEQRTHHDEGDAEREREHRGRAPRPRTVGVQPDPQQDGAGRAQPGQDQQLPVLQGLGHGRPVRDRKQVLVVEAAEHQDDELQPDGGAVGGHHEQSLRPPRQPATGVGQEHVQPQGGQQQVEELPDGVGQRLRRPLQRRGRRRETCRHEQWPEPAVRPAAPRDHAGRDERQRAPQDEDDPQRALVEIVVREREQHDAGGGRHRRGADSAEQGRCRRCPGRGKQAQGPSAGNRHGLSPSPAGR
jgi:hypothetical protein